MKNETLQFLDIILEELNVKEVVFMDKDGHITETYDGEHVRTDKKYGRLNKNR